MKETPKERDAIRSPDKVDSGAEIVKKQTRKQLCNELVCSAREVTGTRSYDVADRMIEQVANALVHPRPKNLDEHIIKATSVMKEMAPQNATEAMLATQMIAVNDSALLFLRYATQNNQGSEAVDANVLRATRLMRVFVEQLEAMQKLNGKAGQQKVTVEHVHVHEGGQAIVGAVTTGEQAGGRGDD